MTTTDAVFKMESRSDATSDPKAPFEQVEYAPEGSNSNPVDRMPAILRSLSVEDRQALNLRLKRRIDLRLLPMMVLMYIMNYLDRNNIASARLAGLEDDLGLVGNQYQVSVSILFVGYLLMQVPSNLLLNKIGKPSLYLSTCMVVWGIVSTCTGAVQSYGGLVGVRFTLGFVEAAYFPGCLFLLSSWYTREELILRTALLYSGSLISGAFSGLLAAAITDGMNGVRGLSAWRWLFIIEGSITVVIAATAYFIIPNFPRTTKWLSEEESAMAIWRLEEDIGVDDWTNSKEQSMLQGAKLAVCDLKAWVLLAVTYGFTSSGSVTTFFPTVVKSLGYGSVDTLLLTAPPYVLGTIIILGNAWHADRTRERYLHIVIGPCIAAASFIIAMTTEGFGPRYFAMMLMIGATYSGYVVTLGYISNVLPRPPAKRAAALAGINAMSNICQIYSPFFYPTNAGPHYILAMSINTGTSCLSIISATILRFMLMRANKLLDQGVIIGNDGKMTTQAHVRDVEENGLPAEAVDRGFRFLL